MLDETQTATLRAAIDRIIPPDDVSPGGVDAGAFDYLMGQLSANGDLAKWLPEYQTAMDALDALARRDFGASFVELDAGRQDQALMRLESDSPRFFRAFAEHAQEGFYISPDAWKMIGWKVTG